jgi:hypothetical protein
MKIIKGTIKGLISIAYIVVFVTILFLYIDICMAIFGISWAYPMSLLIVFMLLIIGQAISKEYET